MSSIVPFDSGRLHAFKPDIDVGLDAEVQVCIGAGVAELQSQRITVCLRSFLARALHVPTHLNTSFSIRCVQKAAGEYPEVSHHGTVRTLSPKLETLVASLQLLLFRCRLGPHLLQAQSTQLVLVPNRPRF